VKDALDSLTRAEMAKAATEKRRRRPIREAPTVKDALDSLTRAEMAKAANEAAGVGHVWVGPDVLGKKLQKCVNDCDAQKKSCKEDFEVMPAGYCDDQYTTCKTVCNNLFSLK
jgi:hypothetical protein